LWFGDTAYLIAPALATVLLFLVAQRFPEARTRWAWRLLGASLLMWTIGDTIWSVYEIGLDMEVPYPSAGDVAYLAAYPFAFAGLLLFPRAPAGGLRRLRLSLDTLIAMVVVATFSSYFVIGELIASSSGESLLADTVNITYPLSDLGLIFAVLVLIARPGPRYLNLPLALLAAGFAVMAVADGLYLYAVDISGYATGDFLDIGWVLSYNLIAYAALVTFVLANPAADKPSPAERVTSSLRSVIPYAVAAPLAVLLVASELADKPAAFHYLVIGGATATFILIVARQVLSIYENAALNRVLGARAEELARRHQQLTLLHRAASALSQRLRAKDVLALARLLISEWASAKQVNMWELNGRRPRLWDDSGDGRSKQRQRPALSVRADRVKLAARNAAPMLFRDGEDQALTQAGEAGSLSQEGTLYIPLASGRNHGAVAELVLTGRPSPSMSDLDLLRTLGIEVGAALDRAHQFEEAREQADRDFVTGLYNHRFVQGELDRSLQACAREGRPLSLVLMDIDNFRLLNETHGHPAGDRLLKIVAGHLASACKGEALAARFGGDEFIALLPGFDRQQALAFAHSLQEWAGGQGLQLHEGDLIPLRMSYGLASYPDHGDGRHELLAAADANLYESKLLGGKIVGRSQAERDRGELRRVGTFGLLESLVTSVDNKDHYTRAHTENVTDYALLLAAELGFSEDVRRTLRVAGLLHDVGKICIPDRILRKPGPLTEEEYEIVKQHVVIADYLLVDLPNVADVRAAVLHHHERFDGSGYARGLKGDEIPVLGRLMAVVDAFSAMVLDRPYRKARSLEDGLAELRRCSGTQFDPQMVAAFVAAVERQLASADHVEAEVFLG
ncbi:MAG TPA: diguanylate cyclase, partial [Dehalococcoidia bacterium]|nr:diguanylate cyclase [Dehalococcoidia bacterium]